jgi:hypothetical protein
VNLLGGFCFSIKPQLRLTDYWFTNGVNFPDCKLYWEETLYAMLVKTDPFLVSSGNLRYFGQYRGKVFVAESIKKYPKMPFKGN